jgi:pimeloyl-ACP methyl ester carboxylesterase
MDSFSSAGVRIAYLDVAPATGQGEPIVLVHGFASTHAVNWVNPQWVKTLTEAGRRVIALDNRGHGSSAKPHAPADYASSRMAEDVVRLMDHLRIERADVMGYSMGARITAFVALEHATRTRSIVLGGLGHHLVDGVGLPESIAEAMEVPDAEALTDPTQRMFRRFADANGQDRAALAACIRGSRQVLSPEEVGAIRCPALVAVGTRDHIAGNPHRLAALFPNGAALDIPDRDHNLAVGDRVYKRGVLDFLARRGA